MIFVLLQADFQIFSKKKEKITEIIISNYAENATLNFCLSSVKFSCQTGKDMLYFFSRLNCRVSTSVVHRLPKPRRRVRLPYPAPHRSKLCIACSDFFISQSKLTPLCGGFIKGKYQF